MHLGAHTLVLARRGLRACPRRAGAWQHSGPGVGAPPLLRNASEEEGPSARRPARRWVLLSLLGGTVGLVVVGSVVEERERMRAAAVGARAALDAWTGNVHPLGSLGAALGGPHAATGGAAALPVGPPPYLFTEENSAAAYVATGVPPWAVDQGGEAAAATGGGCMRYFSFFFAGRRRVDVAVFRATNDYTGRQVEAGTPACPVVINASSIAAARPLALELCKQGLTVVAYTHAGLTLPTVLTPGDARAASVLGLLAAPSSHPAGTAAPGPPQPWTSPRAAAVEVAGSGEKGWDMSSDGTGVSPHAGLQASHVEDGGASAAWWRGAALSGIMAITRFAAFGEEKSLRGSSTARPPDLRLRLDREVEPPALVANPLSRGASMWTAGLEAAYPSSCLLPTPELEAAELVAVLRHVGAPRAILLATGANWASTSLAAKRNAGTVAGLILIDPLMPSSRARVWHPALTAFQHAALFPRGARQPGGGPCPAVGDLAAAFAEEMQAQPRDTPPTIKPRITVPSFLTSSVGHWAALLGPSTPLHALLTPSQTASLPAVAGFPPSAPAGRGVTGPTPLQIVAAAAGPLASAEALLSSPATLAVMDGETLVTAAYARAAVHGAALGHTGTVPSWALMQTAAPGGSAPPSRSRAWDSGLVSAAIAAAQRAGGGGAAAAEGSAAAPLNAPPLSPIAWSAPTLDAAAPFSPFLSLHALVTAATVAGGEGTGPALARLSGSVPHARIASCGLVTFPPPSSSAFARERAAAVDEALPLVVTAGYAAALPASAALHVYETAQGGGADTRAAYVAAQLDVLRARAWGVALMWTAKESILQQLAGMTARERSSLVGARGAAGDSRFAAAVLAPMLQAVGRGEGGGGHPSVRALDGTRLQESALSFALLQAGGGGHAASKDVPPLPLAVRLLARAGAEAREQARTAASAQDLLPSYGSSGLFSAAAEDEARATALAFEAALAGHDGPLPLVPSLAPPGTVAHALDEYSEVYTRLAPPTLAALAPHAWDLPLRALTGHAASVASVRDGRRRVPDATEVRAKAIDLTARADMALHGQIRDAEMTLRQVYGVPGGGELPAIVATRAAMARRFAEAAIARAAAPLSLSADLSFGFAALAWESGLAGAEGVRAWGEAAREVAGRRRQGGAEEEGAPASNSMWPSWALGGTPSLPPRPPALDDVHEVVRRRAAARPATRTRGALRWAKEDAPPFPVAVVATWPQPGGEWRIGGEEGVYAPPALLVGSSEEEEGGWRAALGVDTSPPIPSIGCSVAVLPFGPVLAGGGGGEIPDLTRTPSHVGLSSVLNSAAQAHRWRTLGQLRSTFPPPEDRPTAWPLGGGVPVGTGVLLPVVAASVEEAGAALLALEAGLTKEAGSGGRRRLTILPPDGAAFALQGREWERLPLARAAGLGRAMAGGGSLAPEQGRAAATAGLLPHCAPTTGEPGEPWTDLADATALGPPEPSLRPSLPAVARVVRAVAEVEELRGRGRGDPVGY